MFMRYLILSLKTKDLDEERDSKLVQYSKGN